MKVTNVHSPHAVQGGQPNAQQQQTVKEKAMAAFMGNQAPPTQVPNANPQAPTPVNPSQVAPEDLSALTPGVPTPNIQKPSLESPASLTPEVSAKAETPSTPQPDAQMQALIRREKALRLNTQKAQDALKADRAALAEQKAQLDARQKELETGYVPRQRLKEATLDVLAENEISYDDITQAQMQAGAVNPQVKALLSKLADQNKLLADKIEQMSKSQETQHEESTQAALKQLARDAKQVVTRDTTEQYGFIKHYGQAGIQEVVNLIKAEFDDTGEQMSLEEACQLVEKEYTERFERLQTLKKVQERQKAPVNTQQSPVPAQIPAPQQQPQQMKTLTNAAGSTRQLNARERAILAFEGKQKS